MNIICSTASYEDWLRKQLEEDLVEKDIRKKHKKMAKDAFLFLRATYWRWAETIYQPDLCPELEDAPEVLAVGDIHVENFGTWSDAEGRLVWGVNDFDEAARMPYAIDVVRLATSAVLADVDGISNAKASDSVLAGYQDGIADPQPFVLDREHADLREDFVVTQDERTDFWTKFDPVELEKHPDKDIVPVVEKDLPSRFAKILDRTRPDKDVEFQYFTRTAGTGSLGRPRVFGTGAWRGDLIVREAKAMVCSGWVRAHGGQRELLCEQIASGKHRSPDPTYRLHGRVLVRRLSPNDFKIEAKQKEEKGKKKAKAKDQENPQAVERPQLVNTRVLHAMGCDLAGIHRGTQDMRKAIQADLKRRKAGWLREAVENASRAVRDEFEQWKEHHDKLPDEAG